MAHNPEMVALILGQSNFANHGDTKGACSAGTYALDGLELVRATDPIPGASGTMGSIWTRFGPLCLESRKWDRVTLVNVAEGGTLIKTWAPGGENHARAIDAVHRCRTLDLHITHIFFHQGESDTAKNTSGKEYAADLQALINSLRAEGVDAPMIVCRASYFRGRTSRDVRKAQRHVVKEDDSLFHGPDSDQLTDGYRYDNLHFNNAGLNRMAELLFETVSALPLDHGNPFGGSSANPV